MAAYRNKTVASLFTLGLLALIAVLALVWFGGGNVGAQEEPPSPANTPVATPTPTPEPATPAQLCANDTTVPGHADKPGLVADCVALMAARDALQGTKTLDWSYDRYIGNWKGITVSNVDGSHRVTKLKLHGSAFDGTIPPELGGLSSLQTLDLRDSPELTGPIPAELGELSSLQHLILVNHGAFSSGIPKELGKLSSLQTLIMFQIGLNGGIPSELGDLSALKTLQLSSNQLTGTIPATLVYLDNLGHLSLSENQLTGCIPAALSAVKTNDMASLGLSTCTGEQMCADDITVPDHPDKPGLVSDCAYLIAARDTLRGVADLNWKYGVPISTWDGVRVRPLTNRVTQLRLAKMGLTGTIPAQLGDLAKLETLNLGGNKLTGSIPAELGGMPVLEEIRLSGNQLSGRIPAQLGNLPALRQLWLVDNRLTGSIPPGLGSVSTLKKLMLRDNQLTGEIPVSLGNLWRLTHLSLDNNNLTGSLPVSIYNLSSLQVLRVAGNTIGGCLPPGLNLYLPDVRTDVLTLGLPLCATPAEEFCGDDTVVPGYETNAGLYGDCIALYKVMERLDDADTLGWSTSLSIGQWDGVSVTGSPGRVTRLALNNKALAGVVPAEVGSLTGLEYLDLSDNYLWLVPNELHQLNNLQHLDLGNNKLTGFDPGFQWSSLSSLEYIDVSDNPLTAGVHVGNKLGDMTNLRYADLSNTWFGGASVMKSRWSGLVNMRHLDLSSNHIRTLTGTAGLPDMVNLRYLDLSHNPHLLNESVPVWLGDLTELRFLDISFTQFSGSIPKELGNLTNLKHLDMSGGWPNSYNVTERGYLTGDLPPELGNLSNLKHLAVRHQSLTGSIPRELGNLSALQYLDLSDNGFTGDIPAELEKLNELLILRAYSVSLWDNACLEEELRLIGVDHDLGEYFDAGVRERGGICPSSR